MKIILKQQTVLTGAVLGLAVAIGGCSNVQPRFDDAIDSMKSFFKSDSAVRQGTSRPSTQAEAVYEQALGLRDQGRTEAWLERLEDAAVLGHPAAAYELARIYEDGRHGRKDADTAGRWMQRAADLGDQRAEYVVGAKLLSGDGLRKNPERAVKYLSHAGEQGHVEAQYLMGKAYAEGSGVARNPAWAARWYGRAARAGQVKAQYAYGRMYRTGSGLPKSSRQAYRWLTLAASGGHKRAADQAVAVAKHLPAEAISQVEADARRFVPRNDSSLTDPATVMFVQYALRSIGYDAGPVDGLPGEKTREGIRAYEQAADLPVGGHISVSLLDGLVESTSK